MSAKDFIYSVNNHSVNVIVFLFFLLFLLSINTGGKLKNVWYIIAITKLYNILI